MKWYLVLAVIITAMLLMIGTTTWTLIELGRPKAAEASNMQSVGDTTLAVGASVKLYPCFRLGGGHIHSPQHYSTANECYVANTGTIFTSASNIRVNLYGSAYIDTSGFTIPAGGNLSGMPPVDSVRVLNTGSASTRVTWGFYR